MSDWQPRTILKLRNGDKVFVTEPLAFCRAQVNAAIDAGKPAQQVLFTRWMAGEVSEFSAQAGSVETIAPNV